MVIALWVAVSLQAAPVAAAPRVHAQADVAVYIPRLNKLGPLVGFFERAGEKAGLLRPSGWKSEFHPLLWLDVQRPESFTEAGLSLEHPYTVSLVGSSRMACGVVTDVKRFEEKAASRLSALGERFEKPGKTFRVGAKLGKEIRGGYALRDNQLCAFATTRDGAAFLAEAAKRVEKPFAGPGAKWMAAPLPSAPLYVLSARGIAAVSELPNGLKVEARTRDVPLPAFVAKPDHPQGALPSSGLLFARGAVKPEALASALAPWVSQVAQACPSCTRAQLDRAASTLANQLTGTFLVRVDRAELRGALRTEANRFFAVKQALVAQLKADAVSLTSVFESLGQKSGDGYVLSTPSGELRFGTKDKHVYFANDETAMRAILEGVSRPGPVEHGLEIQIPPPALAKTLSQVSLLDVMAVKELASVFALSAELGPLLAASENLWLKDDVTGGVHSLELRWTLP
jgi:hypothetical protein